MHAHEMRCKQGFSLDACMHAIDQSSYQNGDRRCTRPLDQATWAWPSTISFPHDSSNMCMATQMQSNRFNWAYTASISLPDQSQVSGPKYRYRTVMTLPISLRIEQKSYGVLLSLKNRLNSRNAYISSDSKTFCTTTSPKTHTHSSLRKFHADQNSAFPQNV
jgi:hypothetical protein